MNETLFRKTKHKKKIPPKSQPKKTWVLLLFLFLFVVGTAGVITLKLNGFFSPTANESKISEKTSDKKVESDEIKKQTSSKPKEAEPLLDPEKPVSESIEMKEAPDPVGPTAPTKPEAPAAPKKIEVKLETSQTEK